MSQYPDYAALLERTDAPAGSAWDLYPDPALGSLQRIDPAAVQRGLAAAVTGTVVTLDYPLDAFDPFPSGTRHAPTHTIFQHHPYHRDDHLDGLYLQGSTQIDGLRHIRHPEHGFFSGVPDDAITVGTPDLGIQHWAERGIVTRGVLLDVAGHREASGDPLDQRTNAMIDLGDLLEVMEAQNCTIDSGDAVLIRTGWSHHFLETLSVSERAALIGNLRCPGLRQSHEVVGWVWDSGISLIAADNIALEAYPPHPESPFTAPVEVSGGGAPSAAGLMHRPLIALLGVAIGELWRLDPLADACRSRGRWDFLLTAKPLNLRGGVGSPANAMAIL